MASVALIDNTVSVTTRHSDNVPIASEVTMAWVNREDATGTRRLSKPAVPDDRVMVQILQDAGESPAGPGNFAGVVGNIAAGFAAKTAESRQRLTLCPLLLTFGGFLAQM